jgi:dynein heavy chain
MQAKWANESLPTDPLSVENGAIVSNSTRWPLLVDPQLQGIKWILRREEANGLRVIQQGQPKYIDTVRRLPAFGHVYLLLLI